MARVVGGSRLRLWKASVSDSLVVTCRLRMDAVMSEGDAASAACDGRGDAARMPRAMVAAVAIVAMGA